MRTLVHLSDLHFGHIDPSLIAPIIATIKHIAPDLIVVSGDLTQRARGGQFREARAFLDALPFPRLVVPGNHDVPLYNVFARFFWPLRGYRRHITPDLEPLHIDPELVVMGINTARSLTIKDGRISAEQIDRIRARLCDLQADVVKVLVTHHPFDLPEGHDEDALVGRAPHAMQTLAACGVDMLLAGHLHVSHTGHTALRYKIPGHSALIVQAGTATSTRARGETNSFNVIHIAHPEIRVERYAWQMATSTFTAEQTERFAWQPEGWVRIP